MIAITTIAKDGETRYVFTHVSDGATAEDVRRELDYVRDFADGANNGTRLYGYAGERVQDEGTEDEVHWWEGRIDGRSVSFDTDEELTHIIERRFHDEAAHGEVCWCDGADELAELLAAYAD